MSAKQVTSTRKREAPEVDTHPNRSVKCSATLELLSTIQETNQVLKGLEHLTPEQCEEWIAAQHAAADVLLANLVNATSGLATVVQEDTLENAKERMNSGQLKDFIDGLLARPDVENDDRASDALKAAKQQLPANPDSSAIDSGTLVLIDEAIRRVKATQALVDSLNLIEWALEFLPTPLGLLTKWLKLLAFAKLLKKVPRTKALLEKIENFRSKIKKLKKLQKGWETTEEGRKLLRELDELVEHAEGMVP